MDYGQIKGCRPITGGQLVPMSVAWRLYQQKQQQQMEAEAEAQIQEQTGAEEHDTEELALLSPLSAAPPPPAVSVEEGAAGHASTFMDLNYESDDVDLQLELQTPVQEPPPARQPQQVSVGSSGAASGSGVHISDKPRWSAYSDSDD